MRLPVGLDLAPRAVDGGAVVASPSRWSRMPSAKGGASGVWKVEAGARVGERSATGSAPNVCCGTRGVAGVRGEMALEAVRVSWRKGYWLEEGLTCWIVKSLRPYSSEGWKGCLGRVLELTLGLAVSLRSRTDLLAVVSVPALEMTLIRLSFPPADNPGLGTRGRGELAMKLGDRSNMRVSNPSR